jgi:iron complex transport system ATP-binding protein
VIPILTAQDLAWRAGATSIVQDVTFDVAAGEFVALMGRIGAGKSTLMVLLDFLRRPHAGAVLLDGRRLDDWRPIDRARRIGHLPQSLRLQSPLTAEQIVTMGRYPYGDRWIESDADRVIVERAMRLCGCLPFRRRQLATLSGGERQRVLLAACIAQEPALLLLDEPSTFLDVDQQLQTFAMLRWIAEGGAACIAVSHDLNLALTFCTRIIVLAERTIACDMPVDRARREDGWLELFSPRLRRLATAAGESWVAYQ